MQAGKGRTHSKDIPENIAKVFGALNTPVKRSHEKSQSLAKHAYRHWCFQKLLLFLMFFKKFCIYKHEHRDELARINFTSNKISIKNRTSFICPHYLKHSLSSYGRKLLLWSYLSHNFHKHGVHMAKVYRALIDWLVETQDFSRVINLHRKRTLDGCFHKKLEIHVSSSLSNKQKHSTFTQTKIFLL